MYSDLSWDADIEMRPKSPTPIRVQETKRNVRRAAGCSEHRSWWFWACVLAAAFFATLMVREAALLARPANGKLKLDTGKQIYMAACASCHGLDGRGQSHNLAGFERHLETAAAANTSSSMR